MQQLVNLYMENVVRLYGTLMFIVSDRDLRFISRVWIEFQDAVGTELKYSIAFHPQTDSQSVKY